MKEGPRTGPAGNQTSFEPAIAAEIDDVVEHLNDRHSDTILLLARFAGGALDAGDAEIAAIDRAAVKLHVRNRDGAGEVRLSFPEPPSSLLGARAALFALIREARTLAGDGVPLTSLERELVETAQLSTFVSTVEQIEDITPNLRQITVRGGLERFRAIAPDQFLYLMVSRPGSGKVIEPGFRMEDFQRLPEGERPVSAYYTVRSWDPERGTIQLWIVLHEPEGGVSGWARSAHPGDVVALWGPRATFEPPRDMCHLVLIGDESALPAIAAILEQLDNGVRCDVVVETVNAAHTLELPRGPSVSIHWLYRGTDEAGTGTRLLGEVRALDLEEHGLYAFGAAEHTQIGHVRRFLRQQCGLPAHRVRMTTYWRRTGKETPT